MKRNTLINFVLLAVVAVLALVAVYEPGIEKPAEAPNLITLEKGAISRIAIQREDKADIELMRLADGNWQMQKPAVLPANEMRIDSLLRVTRSKSLGSFAAESGKLADYQLDSPKAVLTLNDSVTIAFGKNTPLDHRRYVLLDDRVHLISDTLYYHLIGDYPTFVSQRPLPTGSEITALQLPGLNVSWEEDRWQLKPTVDDYSPDQLTTLLDNWKYASAIQVKPYDGKPGETVSIKLAGRETPLRFLLTAREPDLVLARPGIALQYHFPAELAKEMLQLPELNAATTEHTDTGAGVN